jgi:histidinol-phosphate aminotransferase
MTVTPRKSIADLVSYRPEVKASSTGRQIRLSVNEGALGPSPMAQDALREVAGQIHRYPEEINADLVHAIATRFSLKPELILPGNGSDELIGLLTTAYLNDGDEAIYTQYGFLVFPQSIIVAGGVPVRVDDDDLTVSVDNIINAVTGRTRLIFLANPNNPTGTMIGKAEIERLIKAVPPSVIIILDSAYSEYISADDKDYTDGAAYVEKHDNVVMLRTFSKIFALSGLRLGWAYLPPGIQAVLTSIRWPFSVNVAAAIAGKAALEDHAFFEKCFKHNEKYIPLMRASIEQAGFKALPTCTNFFLIRFTDADEAAAAHAFMADRGIQLRRMIPYGLPDCLRMSLGNEEEMEITAAAFKDFAAMRKS